MIRGKFQAQDDFDLAGHRLLNWKWLNDIPTDDASDGQVLAYIGGEVVWATATSEGVVSVAWDDITGKPSEYPPEDHTHPWDEVTGKPTFVNSITAGLGIAISGTTGNVLISNSVQADQTEPTGFVGTPETYTSTIAVTDNRTFSIGPAAGETEFSFYIKGVKYTRTSTESVTFPDVEGVYAAYYNENGTLSATATPLPGSIFTENAIIAVWRWDTSEQEVIYFGEERHGIVMDGKTHQYLHDTEGTRMIGGHALSDINADASGDLDSSATLSVESGTIADEDLFLSAAATTNATQTWWTFSKTDNGDWQRHDTGNFPLRVTASATPTYNAVTANGTWSQEPIGNLDYVLAHIYRTNSATVPYICVQGENEYISLAAAREGAANEINDLVTSGLPFVEFHPLGTLIYEHRTSYANTPRARIRVTDEGDNYVDWRFQALTPGSGPGDHGSLAGLGDADHPLTALQQSGATTNQAVVWSGATWVADDVVNNVTAGTGIALSATSGTGVQITCDLTWSELANKPTFVNSVTSGTGIALSATTGASVQITCDLTWSELANKPTFVNSVTAGTNIDVSATTGSGVSIATVTNPSFDTVTASTVSTSNLTVSGGATISGSLSQQDHVYLSAGGTDGDQNIYFYSGGATGNYIGYWDVVNYIRTSTTLYVNGNVIATNYVSADYVIESQLVDHLSSDKTFSATTQVNSGLAFTAQASGYYKFEGLLVTEGNSSLSPNIQLSIVAPSGATVYWNENIDQGGSAPVTSKATIEVNGTNQLIHKIDGIVYLGATGGAVTLYGGLSGAGGNAALKKGSYFGARKI